MDDQEDTSDNANTKNMEETDKLHICFYCQKSYTRKENLRKHSFRCVQYSNQDSGGEIEQSKSIASRQSKNSNKNIDMDCDGKTTGKDDKAVGVTETFKQGHYCHVCGKVFEKPLHLKHHMFSHTGMAFKCTWCSKTFVSKYRLQKHNLTDHKEKQANSKENEGKAIALDYSSSNKAKKAKFKKEEWITGSGVNKNTASKSSLETQDCASNFTEIEDIENSGASVLKRAESCISASSTTSISNQSTGIFKAENQRQFLISSLRDDCGNANYRNVVVFCTDGNVYTNSLLLGLAFPVLSTVGQVMGREIILPDYSVQAFQELVSNILDAKEFGNTIDNDEHMVGEGNTIESSADRYSGEVNTDNDTNGDVDTTIEELLKDDPNETKQAEKQEKPKQDSNDAITGDSMKMMEDLCTKNIAVTTFSTTAEMIVDKYTDDDDTKLADRKKKRDRLVIYCTDCKSNLSLMKYFHHSCVYKGDLQKCRICNKILNDHTMKFHTRKSEKCKKSLLRMAKQTNKTERMTTRMCKNKETSSKDDHRDTVVTDVFRKKRGYTFKKRKPCNVIASKKPVLQAKDLNVGRNVNIVVSTGRDYPNGECSQAEIEMDNAEYDVTAEEAAPKFYNMIVDENLRPTADDVTIQENTDESYNLSPQVILLDQALLSQGNHSSSENYLIKQENETADEAIDIKCFDQGREREIQDVPEAKEPDRKNPILWCSWQI